MKSRETLRMLLEEYVADDVAGTDQVRLDPPSLKLGGRWKPIRWWRMTAQGLQLKAGKKTVDLCLYSPAQEQRAADLDILLEAVERRFPGWRLHRVLSNTDRRRFSSARFPRLVLARGRQRKPVAAVYRHESPNGLARFLTGALLWNEDARSRGWRRITLLVPLRWNAPLRRFLDDLRIQLQVAHYSGLSPGDDSGGLQRASQVHPYRGDPPLEMLEIRASNPVLELVYRGTRWELARFGLPVLWQQYDRLFFNIFRPMVLQQSTRTSFQRHLRQVLRYRIHAPPRLRHPMYRFAPERWMQSLVLQRLSSLGRRLRPPVYCQVPTRLGGSLQVMDMIASTAEGRLAVVELKTHRDISLLLQGAGYWCRVKQHARDGDFQSAGFFPGMRFSRKAPLLILVCPIFDFHRTVSRLARYLPEELEVDLVGVNIDWRRGLRVLRKVRLV